jgi:hypothetical protein
VRSHLQRDEDRLSPAERRTRAVRHAGALARGLAPRAAALATVGPEVDLALSSSRASHASPTREPALD